MRDPPSKYGFPPLNGLGLPATIPWDTPISDIAGLWLLKDCEACGEAKVPLRRLAADRGWKLTLKTIVPKLRCGQCGNPLRSARLTDDPAGTDGRHGAQPRYLELPLR